MGETEEKDVGDVGARGTVNSRSRTDAGVNGAGAAARGGAGAEGPATSSDVALKFRAVTVLVILRAGGRTLVTIMHCLGERDRSAVQDLLCDMKMIGLICCKSGGNLRPTWHLAPGGVGALAEEGLGPIAP